MMELNGQIFKDGSETFWIPETFPQSHQWIIPFLVRNQQNAINMDSSISKLQGMMKASYATVGMFLTAATLILSLAFIVTGEITAITYFLPLVMGTFLYIGYSIIPHQNQADELITHMKAFRGSNLYPIKQPSATSAGQELNQISEVFEPNIGEYANIEL